MDKIKVEPIFPMLFTHSVFFFFFLHDILYNPMGDRVVGFPLFFSRVFRHFKIDLVGELKESTTELDIINEATIRSLQEKMDS